jgi:hypothetical protein
MSKTVFRLTIALVMVLSLFLGANTASALPGTNWATGIKLQNMDPSVGAVVQIDLYNAGGSAVASISTTKSGEAITVAPNKSAEVYLPNYDISSGTFSAVVLSNVKLGAVVTATNYAFGLADSYNAMEPATKVFVPYVYRGHNNWRTEIFIQNTSMTDSANVTVTLVEPETSVSVRPGETPTTKVINLSIPKNGSAAIDTSQPQHADLDWFIGSATITSSIPVAVAFSQVRLVAASNAKGNVMVSGRGLTPGDGGSKVVLPSLYKEFAGASGLWRSGIKIMNLDNSAVELKVTFTSDQVPPVGTNLEKTFTIPANGNEELFLPSVVLDSGLNIPSQWRGYAVIERISGSANVVATVQHTNYSGANGFGVAIGYAGFSQGAKNISLPTLYYWPSGAGVWVTGIKIQNVSDQTVTVEVEYSPDPDSIDKTTGKTTGISLGPNAAKELYFLEPIIDGGIKIKSGWKGSAHIKVTSGDGTVVATVVNTNYGRNVANMYTGVPIP